MLDDPYRVFIHHQVALGRPGASCTTFLKLLANQRDEYHAFTGDVQYHSLTWQEVRQNCRGEVLFCPENDVHSPTLTARETISFAARCRVPRSRLGYSTEKYVEIVIDFLIIALRLGNAG